MDIFVNVALPLSLVVIMLSLGIGLTLDDFKRVMIRPQAFAIGAGAQIAFVPLMTYILILMFGITGELAVGIMLLSLCPGGVTTNIATKIAKGDVALSVSLTAVVSLLNIVRCPSWPHGPSFILWGPTHPKLQSQAWRWRSLSSRQYLYFLE